MSYLVDTNVLLRSLQPHYPMHTVAVAATLKLKQSGNLFHTDWSGEIEYRFKTPEAQRLLALLPK